MEKNSIIKILIVDDNDMVRRSLRLFLELHDDFQLLGEGGDGNEAVQLYSQLQPDVILMDIKMPVSNGIEATKTIRQLDHRVCILALTSLNDNGKVEEMMAAGANAYLLKQASIDQIAHAIRELCISRDEAVEMENWPEGFKSISPNSKDQ